MDTPVQSVSNLETQTPETPKADGPERAERVEWDNHWMSILAMAIFVLFSLGVVAFLYYQNQQLKSLLVNYQQVQTTPTPAPTSQAFETPVASPSGRPKGTATPKACSLEAKICPGGSSVGRTGPNCEFAPCPTP